MTKYCQIVGCENNKGSKLKMYRCPADPAIIQKWTQSIEAQQTFDVNRNVCMVHFKQCDFQKNAVPTIFTKIDSLVDQSKDTADEGCLKCKMMEEKIEKITEDFQLKIKNNEFQLTMNHDVKIQDLTEKIRKMQSQLEQQKGQLQSVRKLLTQENSALIKSQKENDDLKKTLHFYTEAVDCKSDTVSVDTLTLINRLLLKLK